jgi:4-diphosphocytidyl-2-C-methyl-D-erythritol kinase
LSPEPVRRAAPAKINLYLHVVGRRPDGFHLLDSLIAFAGVHDTVVAAKANALTLAVEGPFAAALSGEADNLVLRAARALADAAGVRPWAALRLVKRLPVASGIGGGSSNAAACLRGLVALSGADVSDTALHQIAVGLGADVPVCLRSRISYMTGIGHIVDPLPDLPPIYCVLVNPRVGVPTGPVFQALGLLHGAMVSPPAPPPPRHALRGAEDLAAYLAACRNDLETPARQMVREIGDVQDALFATEGCLLARMSGSGATCFGLYAQPQAAAEAALRISREHKRWWSVAAALV